MEGNQFFDEVERTTVALTLANLQVYLGIYKDALRYLDIAMESQDNHITNHAVKLKERIERRLQEL